MTTRDIKHHNACQKQCMEELFERERWLLGENLGYDPRSDWVAMGILQNRVAEVILSGFGRWMAENIIEDTSNSDDI